MDLNLDNYNKEDIIKLLQLSQQQKISKEAAQQALLQKIHSIQNTQDKLPIKKGTLIEFFINAYFKFIQELEASQVHKNLHTNDNPMATWNSHLKAGKINPLKRKFVKKILNINTRFRDNYNRTKSTDFIYTLPYSVKKIVSMKLLTMEFPKTIYYYSDCLQTNSLFIEPEGGGFIPITIRSGSYTNDALIQEINFNIQNSNITDILFTYDTSTKKVTIDSSNNNYTILFEKNKLSYHSSSYTPPTYNPCGDYDIEEIKIAGKVVEDDIPTTNRTASQNTYKKKQKECLLNNSKKNSYFPGSLGWILGFRKISYTLTNNNPVQSECVFNPPATSYFLLSVNDYLRNHGDTFISAFEKNTLSDNNILAKIITENQTLNCIHIERKYFGPVTIDKLNIKIYDEYGRIIDTNNSDYSFSLELEILYDL